MIGVKWLFFISIDLVKERRLYRLSEEKLEAYHIISGKYVFPLMKTTQSGCATYQEILNSSHEVILRFKVYTRIYGILTYPKDDKHSICYFQILIFSEVGTKLMPIPVTLASDDIILIILASGFTVKWCRCDVK